MKTSEKILDAWHRRRTKVHSQGLSAFRLIFEEGDAFPGLIVDDFAGSFMILWKNAAWKERRQELEIGLKRAAAEIHSEVEARWHWAENLATRGFRWLEAGSESMVVTEAGLRFEIRLGETQHPGLFLDQRDNRRRIREGVRGKKVLNLFCHTGAFTVAALAGGAREVHSVDLSKNYLEWLERNLRLNDLTEKTSKNYAEDAFLFLKNGSEKYDWIVVDPPTFSRGKTGEFSAEKDLEALLTAVAHRLMPGGRILASINAHRISTAQFLRRVKDALRPFGLKIMEHYPLPFDFPPPPGKEQDPYLKSCLIA